MTMNMNQWFDAGAEQHAAGNANTKKIHFKMILVETEDENHDVTSDSINEMFQLGGHTLLFHGTKHFNSLMEILRKGILLSKGARKQDFSHGCGFYLSDHFQAAEKFATKKGNLPNAVIVYRVPDHLLTFGETAGLDLNGDRYMWSRVVKYHRSGCKAQQDVPETANLYSRSFIKGPICRNGFCSKKNEGTLPSFKLKQKMEVQQYCIRSEKCALDFSPLVVGVVIYS